MTEEELHELAGEYDDPERHLWLSAHGRTEKEREFRHYLDWFFTVWSARSGKRAREKLREFYEILERAGFLEGLDLEK